MSSVLSSKDEEVLSQRVVIPEEQSKIPVTLYDCIKPVYFVSRMCGLMPFSIRCDSNGQVQEARVGPFDALWFIGAITTNLALIVFTVTLLREQPIANEFLILHLGSRVLTIAAYVGIIFAIILDMVHRKGLIKILKDLLTFDKNVSKNDKGKFFDWIRNCFNHFPFIFH